MIITCLFCSYIDQIVPGSFKNILNFKLPIKKFFISDLQMYQYYIQVG